MKLARTSLAAIAAATLLLAACGDDDDTSSAATDGAAGAPATSPATSPAEGTSAPPATSGSAGRGGDYYGVETDAPPAATDAPDTTDGAAPAGTAEIVISGFSFSEDITVPVGTTVIIRNDDSAGHTWTADDGAFDTGFIDAGATVEVTMTEAGTFAFHCEVHPSMKGTITVTA
jgi:plastocyanin